ncbi:MAG TPA: hypothetical protein DHW63_06165 [Hyphomonadaceae bacterium]|nr:hypothetical protein [Hyphomonadaceae bacterium]
MTEVWKLFRYRPVNANLWQELELAEFYCCRAGELNDPWDCHVDWRASIQRTLQSPDLDTARRAKLSLLQNQFSRESNDFFNVGVCCFTCKVDDRLMWAHYADSHRGVCLLYHFPQPYFMERYTPERDPAFYFVGASRVFYGDDIFHEWLVSGDIETPFANDVGQNALARLFCSKAQAWAHEEEFRMVMRHPGKVAFEPGFLTQVVFGTETPPDHVRLISQLAKRANRGVTLSQVRKSPEADFGMIFPPVAPAPR